MTYGCLLDAVRARTSRRCDRKSFGRTGEGGVGGHIKKAPSSAPSGHLLPKGRRDSTALCRRSSMHPQVLRDDGVVHLDLAGGTGEYHATRVENNDVVGELQR